MALGRDELHRRLGYHRQGPGTAPLFELNRASVMVLAEIWDQALPPGRETECALTALQEALMWANAAVACNLDPHLAELPEVDVADPLEALLDRVSGPEMTRSAPAGPDSGRERPGCAALAPPEPCVRGQHDDDVHWGHRGGSFLDVETMRRRREVAELDADSIPEQTR
jgi:hypothetical protein